MHRYAMLLALVNGLVALLMPPSVQAGCGTATCPLDLNQGQLRKLKVQAAFEYIAQDQLRAGTNKVAFGQIRRPDHDEIETINRNLLLRADYALNDRFSLGLSLPLFNRRHAHIAAPKHSHAKRLANNSEEEGELQEWYFTRLGDLALWGHFALRPQLVASLGIAVPTGQTDVRNDRGDKAEPSLQPGRGAVGLTFETSFEHTLPSGRLFASTSFRLNGRSAQDYRFGSEWNLYTGGHYALGPRQDLMGQLVAAWKARDEAGRTGEHTDATGGTRLYLSPGLRYGLGPELALLAYCQFPLYENLNAVQLTADHLVLLGLDYQLNLF